MKKLFLLLIGAALLTGSANAQDVFKKSDLVFNVGIGIGNSTFGSSYSNKFPPLSISGEYAVVDNLIQGNNGSIGVGGYLGYTGAKYKYTGADYYWKMNAFIIAARGTFHYQFVKNLDTYAGLMLGYNISSSKAKGDWGGINVPEPSFGGFSFSAFIGARYYFTPAFGVFAELGYGIAYFNLGVTFKM